MLYYSSSYVIKPPTSWDKGTSRFLICLFFTSKFLTHSTSAWKFPFCDPIITNSVGEQRIVAFTKPIKTMCVSVFSEDELPNDQFH